MKHEVKVGDVYERLRRDKNKGPKFCVVISVGTRKVELHRATPSGMRTWAGHRENATSRVAVDTLANERGWRRVEEGK